jgi:uncharacterized protein
LTGVRNALNQGAKPNFFYNPEDSKNSLHVAAEGGYLEILQELLEHGAMIESIVKGSKETALLLAAREVQVEAVKYLVENGANILAGLSLMPPPHHLTHSPPPANTYGNTVLHEAIREGSLELCKYFLSHGADVNYANHKGSTPLHFLCYQSEVRDDDVTMLRKLIQHGADIHARDHRGMTPFLVCCTSGRSSIPSPAIVVY